MCWIYKHHGNNPDCGSEQHMYKQRRHHVLWPTRCSKSDHVWRSHAAFALSDALLRRLTSSFAHTESFTRHLETKNKHFFSRVTVCTATYTNIITVQSGGRDLNRLDNQLYTYTH